MDVRQIVSGAVSGFLAAFLVDLNAWSHSTPKGKPNKPFDWGMAFKRWVSGAVSGALAALGVGQL